MAFVVEFPALFLLFISVILAVAPVCGGQWYVHRRFPEEDFVRHNEVGGVIISIAGTLYAVVLGFLTTAVIRHIRTMQSGTQPEMRM